jgi:hypothetical protein
MLLSFERPARSRRLAGLRPGPCGSRAHLSADLENCTVANEYWVSPGESQVNRVFPSRVTGALPTVTPSGVTAITVKIVRAHGGCLGTKSR